MKVAVIGAGAAGSFAAIAAAEQGAEVVVFDHNEKVGKKLYITGKGRCNFTNACEIEKLFESVVSNPKFLYSSFYTFTNDDVMQFFEQNGVPYKVERGDRVFPLSDKSSDVIAALLRRMKELNVTVRLNTHVSGLTVRDEAIMGVVANGQSELFDRVILASGGKSYPATGSDGSGYGLACGVGHTVTPLRPALVPIILEQTDGLEGLSLRNVGVRVLIDGKQRSYEQGEMLFTHNGVSGPIVLSASSRINRYDLGGAVLRIDLKPALSAKQLDDRILRDFAKYANRDFANALGDLLPKSLIPVIIDRSGIAPYKKVHQITAAERATLVALLKGLDYRIKGLDSIEHGIVTAGGVSVREVNPNTMQSKLVSGLYFAGEVLDLDALTGGYNLQIAFSTGYLAGKSCMEG